MSDQYPQHPQGADPTQAYAQQPGYGTQPHPTQAYPAQPSTMSAEDERTWGAISHAGAVIAMICSAGFLGFLASIAVYVIYKDRGPFVREHTRQALNFQLTLLIAYVVGGILSTIFIGFLVLAAAGILSIIFSIIAGIAANKGEWYRYPLTIEFIRQ